MALNKTKLEKLSWSFVPTPIWRDGPAIFRCKDFVREQLVSRRVFTDEPDVSPHFQHCIPKVDWVICT